MRDIKKDRRIAKKSKRKNDQRQYNRSQTQEDSPNHTCEHNVEHPHVRSSCPSPLHMQAHDATGLPETTTPSVSRQCGPASAGGDGRGPAAPARQACWSSADRGVANPGRRSSGPAPADDVSPTKLRKKTPSLSPTASTCRPNSSPNLSAREGEPANGNASWQS